MTVEKPFTAKFYGRENQYIVLENLLFQEYEPIVIDIKLSRQSRNPTLSQERQEKEKKK